MCLGDVWQHDAMLLRLDCPLTPVLRRVRRRQLLASELRAQLGLPPRSRRSRISEWTMDANGRLRHPSPATMSRRRASAQVPPEHAGIAPTWRRDPSQPIDRSGRLYGM
jgi:hypothetical protein